MIGHGFARVACGCMDLLGLLIQLLLHWGWPKVRFVVPGQARLPCSGLQVSHLVCKIKKSFTAENYWGETKFSVHLGFWWYVLVGLFGDQLQKYFLNERISSWAKVSLGVKFTSPLNRTLKMFKKTDPPPCHKQTTKNYSTPILLLSLPSSRQMTRCLG